MYLSGKRDDVNGFPKENKPAVRLWHGYLSLMAGLDCAKFLLP